jgi:hypothetical protein
MFRGRPKPGPDMKKPKPSTDEKDTAHEWIKTRSAEIAAIIKEKREGKHTQEYCASLIGVSPGSFRGMERNKGATPFSVAQVEVLMKAFNIKHDEIWPPETVFPERTLYEFDVPAGQTINVIFKAPKQEERR